jgi:hypothetical protein
VVAPEGSSTHQPISVYTDHLNHICNRPDRAASPTESHRSLSVTSHQPAISAPATTARPPNSRNPAARRRPRPTAASATPVPSASAGASVAAGSAAAAASSSSSATAAAGASGATGSGSGSGSGTIPAAGGHAPHVSPYVPAIRNWSGPVHAQLEGPGMPVARSVAAHAVALAGPGVDGGGALGPGAGAGGGTPMDVVDGADDGAEADDGRLYCLCQMVSYGDMVACDDDECEREWVSLSLVCFGGGGARGRWLLGSCADFLSSISSTWGVSGLRWPPRACGFVIRVGLNRRTSVRSRGQPLRTGGAAVRTGTRVRLVHPLLLDRDLPSVSRANSCCISATLISSSARSPYLFFSRRNVMAKLQNQMDV